MKFSVVKPVMAQDNWDSRCYQLTDAGPVATIQGFECVVYNVLQVITFFAGIVFFFMFVVGGFKYLFSGGDSKKVSAAATTLTFALAGIIGMIISVIVFKLISNITGITNLNTFKIPN